MLPRCATCKELYAGRSPAEDPPCEDCRPAILEDNKDAFLIYSFVQNQYIVGPSGPVDINHLAIWEAIDRFSIKDGPNVFKKVVHLSRWVIERMNKENKG